MRTIAEVNEQIYKAASAADSGLAYTGMTYEEGVQSALEWIMGQSNDPPMEG